MKNYMASEATKDKWSKLIFCLMVFRFPLKTKKECCLYVLQYRCRFYSFRRNSKSLMTDNYVMIGFTFQLKPYPIIVIVVTNFEWRDFKAFFIWC